MCCRANDEKHPKSPKPNKSHAMADHADNNDDGDIFIYRGGRAPLHVTHARIDISVDDIEDDAFYGCKHLLTVETHDGIRKVKAFVFYRCRSLRRINLKSAVEINTWAFATCVNLESVEFGDRLQIIRNRAFYGCSLTNLKLPSIITIGTCAFSNCSALINVELSERLESIDLSAFYDCKRLERIAVPLKRDLFKFSDNIGKYNQFDKCEKLARVDLVGGIHETVASLQMESWRTEMVAEINRINQVLPNTPGDDKTHAIRQWMEFVLDKMDHFRAQHCRYVKEGITLLELALWKAKLCEKEEYAAEMSSKRAKVDSESYRRDRRITCGADIVINNVIPFLKLV